MRHFVFKDCDGIVRSTTSTYSETAPNLPDGWEEVFFDLSKFTIPFKITNGIPEQLRQPANYEKWCNVTNDWVLDIDLVTSQQVEERNRLLRASDVYVLPDYPFEDKEAIIEYRQALRDVTQQPGFPLDFDMPIDPVKAYKSQQPS